MTGVPVAILDGGPITAMRTAAVSGVAIRRSRRAVARPADPGRHDRGRCPGPQPPAGARARPAGRRARDQRPRIRTGRRRWPRSRATTDGIGAVRPSRPTARDAVGGCGRRRDRRVVRGPVRAPGDDRDWLARRTRSSWPSTTPRTSRPRSPATQRCSWSTSASSSSPTARRASSTTIPDPTATIGEAIVAGTPRPAGRPRRRDPPRRRPRRRHLRRRDRAPRAEAGLGVVLPR